MVERSTAAVSGPQSTPPAMSYTEAAQLAAVRAFVRSRALELGLPAARADLLLVAVSELATNTLQHTAGGGRVRVWADVGDVLCDVTDSGPVRSFDPVMPAADSVRGRGLAIVKQVCDEVSVSAGPAGTVVLLRLHI